MHDSYQAIYDAVRSRISGCDVAEIIRSAVHLDGSYAIEGIAQEFRLAAYETQRPSVLFRPNLTVDGNQWCALYGADLVQGVAGFGDTPGEAMRDFDRNWEAKLQRAAEVSA